MNVQDISFDLSNNLQNILYQYQTGENGYLQNYEALEQLQQERNQLINIAAIGGAIAAMPALVAVPIIGSLIVIPGFGLTLLSAEYLSRVSRLSIAMELLLERFGNEGIKITPRIKTEEGIIDLFVKMPDKRSFAFMLRNNGISSVKWRVDKQAFYINRKGKTGTKKWDSVTEAIEKLDKLTRLLRKQKSPILGSSSNERSKPITKAIVLAGQTRIDPNNEASLFTEFGSAKVLRVHTDVITYVTQSEDLINFLLPADR